jgi:hypothetical protein
MVAVGTLACEEVEALKSHLKGGKKCKSSKLQKKISRVAFRYVVRTSLVSLIHPDERRQAA